MCQCRMWLPLRRQSIASKRRHDHVRPRMLLPAMPTRTRLTWGTCIKEAVSSCAPLSKVAAPPPPIDCLHAKARPRAATDATARHATQDAADLGLSSRNHGEDICHDPCHAKFVAITVGRQLPLTHRALTVPRYQILRVLNRLGPFLTTHGTMTPPPPPLFHSSCTGRIL